MSGRSWSSGRARSRCGGNVRPQDTDVAKAQILPLLLLSLVYYFGRIYGIRFQIMIHVQLGCACSSSSVNQNRHQVPFRALTASPLYLDLHRLPYSSLDRTTSPRLPSTVPCSCSLLPAAKTPLGCRWSRSAPDGARPTWELRRLRGRRNRERRVWSGGRRTSSRASTGSSIGMGHPWLGNGRAGWLLA